MLLGERRASCLAVHVLGFADLIQLSNLAHVNLPFS